MLWCGGMIPIFAYLILLSSFLDYQAQLIITADPLGMYNDTNMCNDAIVVNFTFTCNDEDYNGEILLLYYICIILLWLIAKKWLSFGLFCAVAVSNASIIKTTHSIVCLGPKPYLLIHFDPFWIASLTLSESIFGNS